MINNCYKDITKIHCKNKKWKLFLKSELLKMLNSVFFRNFAMKGTKFFVVMQKEKTSHYYISVPYIYIPYHYNIATNWEP